MPSDKEKQSALSSDTGRRGLFSDKVRRGARLSDKGERDAMPSDKEKQSALSPDKERRRMLPALILIPAAAAVLMGAAAWLLKALPSGFPLCPMLRMTGLKCPLCGGTHAVLALLRGDLPSAVWYNPMVTAAVPVGLWIYLRLVRYCFGRGPGPFDHSVARGALIALAVIVLLFTFVRNTPVYKAYLY